MMPEGRVPATAAATIATPTSRPRATSSRRGRRRLRVDHLVVDVVAQRVGDGEQQAVGGGERRGQAAGRHQARHHVRQAGDLRHRQHDDVLVDDELGELQDAVVVGVPDGEQAADLGPVLDPGRELRDRLADHVLVDLELRERRIGRRREVEQEDEEERPADRVARLADAGRREVAHQDVRQRGRADHQAEHQGPEVVELDPAELARGVGEGRDVGLRRCRASARAGRSGRAPGRR